MQANNVYFGTAKRVDFDAILSEEFSRGMKVYFAWGTQRAMPDGNVRDDFIGLFSLMERLWAVVAYRVWVNGAPGGWNFPFARTEGGDEIEGFESIGSHAAHRSFDPHKEINRAFLNGKAMGMPKPVIEGYMDACARMIEAQNCWNAGVEEP